MKYLFINSVYGLRSTGKIVSSLCHELINAGMERTKNQQQLAEIYTAADVFVNPTHLVFNFRGK